MVDVHPELAHLAFLLGTWEGAGRGEYPTIEPFEYTETISLQAPPGKGFITYAQSTARAGAHPDAGAALHTETGYFRPVGGSGVELVLAQPTGIVEVHVGDVSDQRVHLTTNAVARTPSSKAVSAVERVIEVSGDVLRYDLLMEAVGQPHQLHLRARLTRG